MPKTYLVITSIANSENNVLKAFAEEAYKNEVSYIVIGDTKSPEDFNLPGCDFYSVRRQQLLSFNLAKSLPLKHYARKNLGYLLAITNGAEKIIETDDDNIPLKNFWIKRNSNVEAFLIEDKGWVNVYKYFTESSIWPRGFPLEEINSKPPNLKTKSFLKCPIQQGLADQNPDVDAIYRLTRHLPLTFNKSESVALGSKTFCPFNSQNTTWFKEAFPLLYLPSFCNFRMTDIWRSFVAQRIAWTCGWPILFHHSTVRQERNDHELILDFKDEIAGYLNNFKIVSSLNDLDLEEGVENIPANMRKCYKKLIELDLFRKEELQLLNDWLNDIK